MAARGIFKDRERLSPSFPIERHWKALPHRTKQLEMLWSLYGDILEKRGNTFLRVVQVIGPAGTGKTSTLRLFGHEFEERARALRVDMRHVYVNLKLEGGRKVVLYRSLLSKVDPALSSPSLSAEEMLRNLTSYLIDERKHVLLTLDEIDYFLKHYGREEGVLYDLTRLNELTPDRPCGIVGITFLARERSYRENLDRVELSSLGRSYVEFPPYTSSQVFEIIQRRAEEALMPGSFSDEVLELIADITSRPPVHGDMRYALDLLLYSGTLAEAQGAQEIRPEHVRRVYAASDHAITSEDIFSLGEEEKLVLLGLARALASKAASYVTLREIRSFTGVVTEELGRKPISEVDEYLQDLSDRGIVDVKSLTRIGISGVPAEDLGRLLENIMERVRSGLNEPEN